MTTKEVNMDFEYIYSVIKEVWGYDFIVTSRRLQYVLPRAQFYFMCREYTNYSLHSIGKFMKKDHASVIHGINNQQGYMTIRNYKSNFIRVKDVLDEYFSTEKDPNKTYEQRLIDHLSNQLEINKKKNTVLSRILYELNPSSIHVLIAKLSKEQRVDIIENRIIPYIKMHTQTLENTRNSNVKIVN